MAKLDKALLALRSGKVVAAPTESCYGLLADIANKAALESLLSLKPRGADKGQPLIAADEACWRGLVTHVPSAAETLARRFWPGRLSIVLEAAAHIDARLALGGTLAVRVPGPSPALDLVRAFRGVLTATSANLPGQPPALEARELGQIFREAVQDGRLFVLDGTAPGGLPSTLVRVRAGAFQVLREGEISAQDIQQTPGLTNTGSVPH
jgi:tRNA threonylcarbamoyl adenosine modification protein (Sua5/YciO/YrdC/YwlC family)